MWGAVVETVTRIWPLPVMVFGPKVHVLSAGSPAQVKLIALVKPLETNTLMGMLPDIPADVIFTKGTAPRLVRNPGWIVKLTDCVLGLGLKLLSPLYDAVIVYWPASKGTIGPFDNRGLLSTEVLPSLFNKAGFPFGIVPVVPLTVALNVTVPVGTPFPEVPCTSARMNTGLPNGRVVNGTV